VLLKRAGRNITFKALSELVPRALAFIVFAYAARKLGAGDFGKFSFAVQYAMLFGVIVDPGMNILFIRDVAADRALAPRYINQFAAIKSGLAIAAYLAAVSVIVALGYPSQMVALVAIVGLMPIALAGLKFVGAIFTSWEKIEYEALINVADRIVMVPVACGILYLGYGLLALSSVIVATHALSVLIGVLFVSRYISPVRLSVDWSFCVSILRRVWPLAAMVFLATVYMRGDVVMLSLLGSTDEQIGWYCAGVRIIDVIGAVPFLVMAGLFPIFSDLYENNRQRAGQLFRTTQKLMCAAAFPAAVGGFFVADSAVALIYGEQYLPTSIAFKIVTWRIVFVFMNVLFFQALIATRGEKQAALVAGLGASVNIGLNLWFIPRYGYVGAAASGVLSGLAVCAFLVLSIRRALPGSLDLRAALKPLAGVVIMAVVLTAIGQRSIAVLVPCGVVVYGLTQLAFRTFSAEELGALRGLWRKE